MKLAFVTPRYGIEVHGGAERAALMLAQNVVRHLDWPVEVFTSCALESSTWADHYEPGTTQLNGVTVNRFAVGETGRRAENFDQLSAVVHANPPATSSADQERWIDKQGPTAPALIDAVVGSDADLIAFYPYLYHPTVRGLPLVADRAILHPAAHDEPSIKLPIFSDVFSAAQAFVFHTDSERRLVEQLFPIAHKPQINLGLGVEPGQGDETAFRKKYGLGNSPYLLCLGRVDEGKGAHLLADYFRQYKLRQPGDLKLVYVGPVVQPLATGGDIVVCGPVDESEKWAALAGAELLVSPSPNESFSIVLLEAWSAGLAVMVNSVCHPTVEHCRASGGGVWFSGYLSFEISVNKLLQSPEMRQAMAGAGRSYVERTYSWSRLTERYGSFCERLAANRAS